MSTEILWYGQATTIIKNEGKVLVIDPWFSGNPVCTLEPEELGQVDMVAVTHGHFDHFGDTLKICRLFNAKLISTPEIAWYADGKGIPRGKQAIPMSLGGKLDLEKFTISMVPAVHSSALYGEEWETKRKFIPDGGSVGYIIKTPEGSVVYHAGDTALFLDLKLIADRFNPDLGLLPIGGRFTMDISDACCAIEWLKLEKVIPIHYNTYPEIAADPNELVHLLKEKNISAEVVVLKPGGNYFLK